MVKLSKEVEQIGRGLIGFRQDPIGFLTTVLGIKREYVWDKMVEVGESVRDHQLTAVPAGHSVSKTFGAGRWAVWFKMCFMPSTVITTAPSDNQVRNQLWREIHAAHSAARYNLGGKMTTLLWELKPSDVVLRQLPPAQREQWEKNFAIGFSTSPDTVTEHATKMHGWHNEWVLVIVDEACGIMPQIWRSIMEGLVTNERVKVLAIGNPTDPNSEFAKACQPGSGWNVVRISCLDTPNYKQGSEVIPGLAGRDYIKRMRLKYGEQSNQYKYRILGEFPTFREGTYFGFEVSEAEKKGQFSAEYSYDPTAKVHAFYDLGDIHTVGLFVQFRKSRIRVVDSYYDNQGRGLPELARVIQAKPYIWANTHYAGPDLVGSNRKSVQTGRTTRDVAAGLGMNLSPVIQHQFNDGIEAMRSIWPLLDINTDYCQDLIDAAGIYGKKRNERLSADDKPVYFNEPVKNWTCHWLDALRHLAIFYRYMYEEGYIGYATDRSQDLRSAAERFSSPKVYDPLAHTRRARYDPLGVAR